MLMKKTVDGILSGLAKMEAQLNALAISKGNDIAVIEEKVVVLEATAAEASGERERAMRVASKIRAITE